MAGKMEFIKMDQNEIFSNIQKLSPKSGDVLLFYIKTDKYGTSIIPVDTVYQAVQAVRQGFEDGVTCIFLNDRICLSSIDEVNTVINS